MKAAVWSLACCCILSGTGELLFATPPAELGRSAYDRPQSSRRTAYNPVVQSNPVAQTLPMQAGLQPVQPSREPASANASIAPIADRQVTREIGKDPALDIAEPSLAQEAITRPWEVNDAPRPLKAQAASKIPQPATTSTSTESATRLRQNSPAPASSLVAPASPMRPAPRLGNGDLLGNEAEYGARDGFTYSVRTTNIAGQSRPSKSTTPRTARAPRPLEGLKPAQPVREGKTRSAAAPRPLTTSSNLRRTAPTRWFRPNPLRDTSIAQPSLRSAPYVQQTSAQSPAGEATDAEGVTLAQQPATEPLDPLPSIGDEQPLPFDLNAADKEAAAPTNTEAAPSNTEAAPPREEKASEPLEDDLSLDDLPFGDTEKKAPAETSKPLTDSPFPESTPSESPPTDSPAAETPAKENSTAPKSDEDLPLPFDLPAEEKKPADTAPMQDEPAETAAPVEELPLGDTSTEALPTETPATQPAVTETNGTGVKSIMSITTSIAPPAGELPADRSKGSNEEVAVAYCTGQSSRGWSVSEYNWKPTGMFHQPLYFEEVNLERYGYSHGAVQPAISYGQFLLNVIAMPYKVMAEPSREEVYTLGHYRPGSYAPYRIHYPPASVSGGLFEAGVVIGLVFLIP